MMLSREAGHLERDAFAQLSANASGQGGREEAVTFSRLDVLKAFLTGNIFHL